MNHAQGRSRTRRWIPAAVLALLTAAGAGLTGRAPGADAPGAGSPVYVKESDQAKASLHAADAYIRSGKWAEALDVLERLITAFPDSVYPVDAHRYISLRDYCHRRLAALPAEALALYRRRVDVAMRVRFDAARTARDAAALERLVDEGLCSSVGDDALDLLGDIAFERGDLNAARDYWRRIVEVCPDPSVDRATVSAKATLCLVALGQKAEAERELAALAKTHPQAQGVVAGRRQNLVAAVSHLMQQGTFRAPRPTAREDWPTLGGSARRTAVAAHPVEKGGFQWVVDLRDRKWTREYRQRQLRGARRRRYERRSADQWLSFHPVIVGDEAIVCDDANILGIHLHTGKRRWFYNKRGEAPGQVLGGKGARSAMGGAMARYTLSADAGRLYARLGRVGQMPAPFGIDPRRATPRTWLVAIDLTRRESNRPALWRRDAALGTLDNLQYEGAPLGADGDCFVCLSRGNPIRQCYLARLDGTTGRLKWLRYLCEGATAGRSAPTALASLDGRTVFCCTNLGLVAAVRASDGGIQWLARYRRDATDRSARSPRDLNPCVCVDGLVVAAPSDSGELVALDARTGRRRWVAPGARTRYLLGANHGLLFAIEDVPVAYALATGRRVWPRVVAPAKAPRVTYGRGVLAGDVIYWPTQSAIERIDQRTGRRVRPQWSMIQPAG